MDEVGHVARIDRIIGFAGFLPGFWRGGNLGCFVKYKFSEAFLILKDFFSTIPAKNRYIYKTKQVVMIADIITISPEIQSGTPVFSHSRVPVKNLFDYLRGGDSVEEFLHDFPSVKKEQVYQLLALMEQIITYDLRPYDKSAA
jgi:uncharacterized protein (DUF433 family)